MIKVSSRLFPIGFIISVDAPNFNPNDFYIDGNWERIKGRVIVGVDEGQTEFNATGKIGGSKTHTLSLSEIPSHQHKFLMKDGGGTSSSGISYVTGITTGGMFGGGYSEYVGGGKSHNNLQPYQTAYMWKLISYSN